MKITRIELSEEEQLRIECFLIGSFNEEDKPQSVQFDLSALFLDSSNQIEGEAELELYTEHSEPSKYNHETPDHLDSEITSRSVSNFRITFFHEGEEIEVSDWNIEDKIRKYYEK